MAKVNTTKSVSEPVTDRDLENQIRELGAQFSEEKKAKVSIPKGLQKSIGPTLYVGINGVGIVIPVDGEDHPIPESFAAQVKDYLKNLTT